MKRRLPHDLAPILTADDLLEEVLASVNLSGRNRGDQMASVYRFTLELYRGQLTPYLACDTDYHDIWHVAEVFLAMGRLINGARIEGERFTEREIMLGLTAAILHDAGYLRSDDEKHRQGAVFRAVHEKRSMAFVSRHGGRFGLSDAEIRDCRSMIQCTIIAQDIDTQTPASAAIGRLGRMLAVADLLAQLASTTYLEKLMYLFEEDQYDVHSRYTDPLDCYRKALTFDKLAHERLQQILPETDSFLEAHFRTRWGMRQNLYNQAAARQIEHLSALLRKTDFVPQRHLRRWGSLEAIRRVFV